MESAFNKLYEVTKNHSNRVHKLSVINALKEFRVEDESDIKFLKRIKSVLLNIEGINWAPSLRELGGINKGVFTGIKQRIIKQAPKQNLIDLDDFNP